MFLRSQLLQDGVGDVADPNLDGRSIRNNLCGEFGDSLFDLTYLRGCNSRERMGRFHYIIHLGEVHQGIPQGSGHLIVYFGNDCPGIIQYRPYVTDAYPQTAIAVNVGRRKLNKGYVRFEKAFPEEYGD